MGSDKLDDVDKGILYLIQQNARTSTTAEIAEKLGVSSSTVGNRIQKLEERGVISGYHLTVDYEKVGLDQHLLAIGTVPYERRETLSEQILEASGVVSVRELLTNKQNVAIELVGYSRKYIESAIDELNDIGVAIERIEMMKRERTQPFDDFGKQYTNEEDTG
ncbi:Lrp/AsnC family transcriptional regulator [Halorussus gelatinilyticus]|uniref:Lrp/AsnC family transcriptional regulator n=1 Tax=Halorussus gelatinilyticus TaxID=2937524 RepID=A0A8U0IDW0_9EURY|nr:Lrp/AsnC family transcriptional regulator [Halorussus gelatinilyticus]UPV99122.1 Lrp/AsnC family transcriptional regulator [Halorussus gelatinilyticus]